MQKIRVEEIIKAVDGEIISGDKNISFTGICTDSRKVNAGDLFVPIVGLSFDGHDFIDTALSSGALGSFTDRNIISSEDKVLIKVKDTLKALGDLAAFYRAKFNIPFVGITGSVGKTSTKDIVASVLNQKFKVLKTEGNFNNEIGLPLTIFRLEDIYEVGVVEMGMSSLGEISRLTAITQPQIGIITNIGLSHIEKLRSKENILKAKLEMLEGLKEDGLVVLNGDDDLLYDMNGKLPYRLVYYGTKKGLDYKAFDIETKGEKGTHFKVSIMGNKHNVFVPVPGVHNVYNALAAIAVGVELAIPVEDIIKGIEEFTPGKMRLEITKLKDIKIINDVYNASPQSMEAAIDVLKEVSGKSRSIAVLGDMLEMGEWSSRAHIKVGRYVASKNIDCLIAVGRDANKISLGALEAGMKSQNILSFSDNKEAAEFLLTFTKADDVILFKGSRGMKMEEIINHISK